MPTAQVRPARTHASRQIAAALFLLPSVLTAAFASLIVSRGETPSPALPVVAAVQPLPADDRPPVDVASMLPAIAFPTTAPRFDPPGGIGVSTLRILSTPPDVPAILPDVVIPPRDFALASTPPSIEMSSAVATSVPAAVDMIGTVPPLAVVVGLSRELTPPLAGLQDAQRGRPVEQCVADAGFTLLPNPKLPVSTPQPQDETARQFGVRLARAAQSQTASLVIYNARYVRIAYPGGDVSPFYGVCTDVIVRAYRALGTDLQIEVAEAGVGSGDRNIDHRRTEVMRKFLAKRGETLPISDNPDDYHAGDIVTYYRPQNKSSTAHIAIVSDVIGPSGQPMIIHNRGWGVQLEDALFVDKITGHYRYVPKPRADDVLVASGLARPAAGRLTRDTTSADAPRIRPKTPDGSTVAKAGTAAGALP